jgi:catechol 2,3-dioxygenase-like lactoylglutathione lyase family enzyme
MSIIQLDHIVIAVSDLEQAVADYKALGFNVLRGGAHPGRQTHNALVVFADGSYFELIAWRGPSPEEAWWQKLTQHGEGLVDFALLPSDTATVVREAAARGLKLDGPQDGGRLRPDGVSLRWQTARSATGDLPFLCGDLTPRGLRVPEDAASRSHPNGASGVAELAIAVQDVSESLARWAALLGDGGPHLSHKRETDAQGVERASFTLGAATRLVLEAPRGVNARALHDRLATRGPGPWQVTLRTEATRLHPLPPAHLLHGAALQWTTKIPERSA